MRYLKRLPSHHYRHRVFLLTRVIVQLGTDWTRVSMVGRTRRRHTVLAGATGVVLPRLTVSGLYFGLRVLTAFSRDIKALAESG